MNIHSSAAIRQREKMLKLREELFSVEVERMAGRAGCTLEELEIYLEDIITEG